MRSAFGSLARVFLLTATVGMALGERSAIAQEAPRPTPSPEATAAGEQVARTWCVACHAVEDDAGGTVSDQAPPFRAIAAVRSPDYLRGFLAHPHAPMPPLELSRADIENVVAYIESMESARP